MSRFGEVDRASGRVAGARWLPSPNRDARPPGCDVELVVIHAISLPPGQYGGPWIDRLFTNRLDPAAHPYFAAVAHLRVSAHLLIHRDGGLTQYVSLHERAWHAGESAFRGRPRCNDYSVGIELEGPEEGPFEPVQYHTLEAVLAGLRRAWPALTADRIVGHADIAPGRKRDPGAGFDWVRVRRALDVEGSVA
ncbi:1,6-anhydro-N-acetylmuramyl-L-alanine amidase AmpD [Inmirania thermothiophila]|uniref:1,6-anhydro-N-acetylmuramyl-L-alanine amidase AmpD n=1 Tax=Inmirania thermothiophila TaxID=1750597 RepID=A0A3N1YCJ7_9GAMM|nr:1,6-anhydro-N-acetylmuramyl-L-alanine amidase AmpD [Inmirania thermothiophila]ROR35117.1 AmpD protein [Inmirania thermothiophila]